MKTTTDPKIICPFCKTAPCRRLRVCFGEKPKQTDPMSESQQIQDEFTNLPVSRTRKNQLRHMRDGLCEQCKRPHVDGYRCEIHKKKNAIRCRDRYREKVKDSSCQS